MIPNPTGPRAVKKCNRTCVAYLEELILLSKGSFAKSCHFFSEPVPKDGWLLLAVGSYPLSSCSRHSRTRQAGQILSPAEREAERERNLRVLEDLCQGLVAGGELATLPGSPLCVGPYRFCMLGSIGFGWAPIVVFSSNMLLMFFFSKLGNTKVVGVPPLSFSHPKRGSGLRHIHIIRVAGT